ncbi:HupE/UreJ family protein [Achromobacter aloeverae]|uniref:Urease accessory protein UreJ n=1 Tax=Achromobacter aloeverae TaxID=1750518 RepID=A0A4V1MRG6_9BURK|nr:HupE/UreJ family protein [Achromobacter aloeverae]RXN83867.1 urease accessory protein UreJ [Achromobacter aloeverae]
MQRSHIARAAALLALFAAGAARAHPGHEHVAEAAGWAASATEGFLHPLTGADHLCAMIVLGVWSALTSRRAWLAPLAFASVLLLGALLGLARVPLPAVEPMIAVSLLVLGLLTATRARLPEVAGALVAGGFALFHGHAHGYELPETAIALPYIAGFMVATVALHAAGIAAGLALRSRGAWLARATGLGVAAYGVLLLAA